MWDEIRCWYRAEVGQVVSVSCSNVSQLFANNQGKSLQLTYDDILLHIIPVSHDVFLMAGLILLFTPASLFF